MDLYNVIVSPKANSQLDSYIGYIQYTLLNEQAAESVWQDAMRTRNTLATVAGNLKLCENKRLRELKYHIIHFEKHRYVMLYRIEEKTAYVDAIYHELQDYESIFIEEVIGEN